MRTLEYQSSLRPAQPQVRPPRRARRPMMVWVALSTNILGASTAFLSYISIPIGRGDWNFLGGLIVLAIFLAALAVAIANVSVTVGMLLDPEARRDRLSAISSTLCALQLIYWVTLFLILFAS